MKSRLLVRLEADIGRALTFVGADCLRCERAAYLARCGDLPQAVREIAGVQRRYTRHPNIAISAWSGFGEALICHAVQRDLVAIDKMKRSHALSRAAGLRALQALAAAWLAYFAWLRMDVPAMSKFAVEAMCAAGPDDHAARGRANLVIAQGYDASGRHDLARSWYTSARYHATQEGDDAMQSALMWAMASLRVAALQQGAAGVEVDPVAGEQVLLSVESSAHFDEMLGMRSATAQTILRARVCSLLGRTDEALALYDKHVASLSKRGSRPADSALLADRAWCLFVAGREEESMLDADASESRLGNINVSAISPIDQRIGPEGPARPPCADAELLAFDARAAAHGRLVQLHDARDNPAAAARHESLARTAWEDHRRHQARMLEMLDLAFAAATA